ncbi:MAG: transglycosylase SLT domain-containing protein [Deltaproteobacteria bacterium]|nr:transglycosylase SLT domain-containing protein [Deltaproteobacteria bacterium]
MRRSLAILCCLALPASARSHARGVEDLAVAAEAYRQGRFDDCAQTAGTIDRSGLLNPDAALLLEAQCLFYARRPAQALERFDRLRRQYPQSPWAGLAAFRAADCLWETGERSAAAGRYAEAEAGADPRCDGAVGLYRRAVQAGPAGGELWLKLRLEHAQHPLAAAALVPRLDFRQGIELAAALHQARRWSEALDLLDGLPDPGHDAGRFALAYRAGRILFDMRGRYGEASRLLLAARDHAPGAVQAQEAWFWGSRALGRADRDDEAIASHRAMVERHPGAKLASRALFYAGWLAQNRGDCERAKRLFASAWQSEPRSSWAREARWFAAWCELRSQRWKAGAELLRAQLDHPDWRLGGRALYWTGLAMARQKDGRAAQAAWRRCIERHPLTWYALLARARLGPKAPPQPPPPPGPPDAPVVADPLLQRASELDQAGLPGLASAVLRQRERAFLQRHPARADRLALLDAYRQAENFHRPWLLTLRKDLAALRSLPEGPEARSVWDHAYPACERERLERHAGADRSLALFLQAIMRTESGFDPTALSVADARGLMQMIPPTAVRVAAELGIDDYDDEMLFDPEPNIRTAAWYIGALAVKFKRQWPLVAASYNGGPPAAMRWCREHGEHELDAFVESIPFSETRRYAKAVTTTFARYAYLEKEPPVALSLELDPDYLESGPDY